MQEGIPTGKVTAPEQREPEIHIFATPTPAMIKHCWLLGPIFAQAACAFAEMLESNVIDRDLRLKAKKPTPAGMATIELDVKLVQCPADERMGGLPGEMRISITGGRVLVQPQAGIDEAPVDLTEGPKVGDTKNLQLADGE